MSTMRKELTYDEQKELVKENLITLQRSSVNAVSEAILIFYEVMMAKGVEPEVITAELEEYKKNLPNYIGEISLTVCIEGFPDKSNLN